MTPLQVWCAIILLLGGLLYALTTLEGRLKRSKAGGGMSDAERAYIASDEFLRSFEWRRVRYRALDASDGRCQACGRNKHQLPPGEYLNVDHVIPRRVRPDLALDVRNLQILCGSDNHGKCNSTRDWRHPDHPHRMN